jgi:hypothetical protein
MRSFVLLSEVGKEIYCFLPPYMATSPEAGIRKGCPYQDL